MATQSILHDNYDVLKTMMRKYLGDIVDSENFEHLFKVCPYVYEPVTYQTRYPSLKGMTYLQNCVSLVPTYPSINDYLEEYLQKYNDVNEVNEFGWSALHYACNFGLNKKTKRLIKILINANANVNLQGKSGCTPLHIALYHHIHRKYESNDYCVKIIRMLIFAGADVFNIRNIYGYTSYKFFSPDLIKHFEIDYETKTIGIMTGQLTKPAKK